MPNCSVDTKDKLRKASDYLIFRAYPNYIKGKCGNCARVVREALEFAFDPKKLQRIPSAKDYGKSLEAFGFTNIKPDNYKPELGDIAIIDYLPHGHISMYCEGKLLGNEKSFCGWVSDFRQKDMYGGPIRDKKPPYSIYRMV